MIQLTTFIKNKASSLYNRSTNSFELINDLTDRTTKVAKKVLFFGIYTATCWSLWWMNPRIAPLGYICGFIGQKPVQWIIDDLSQETLTKSKVDIFLVSVSMFLSGIITFPIVIPTAIFSTSVYMGKKARDRLFPTS